jgi:membrane-associated phospholipid phosphatase
MNIKSGFTVWLLVLVSTVLACVICIRWIDSPVAHVFQSHARQFSGLERGLGSSVLVTGELVLLAVLALTRLVKGCLPEYGKVLFVATLASLASFDANDNILKVIFGRQNPSAFLHLPTMHVFYFMQGDDHSSFPSGHMAMATAFAAVLMRLYPRTRSIFVTLLSVSAITLLIGEWHFVSDVVAGTFVGGTAGFAAGEILLQNIRSQLVSSRGPPS